MSFFSDSSIARPTPLNAPSRRSVDRRRRRRRAAKPMNRRRRRSTDSKAVLRRLQALKELIPSISTRTTGDEVAPPPPPPQPVDADRIFEDAAGYILRMKMQVEILRHLVNFYGTKEKNAD